MTEQDLMPAMQLIGWCKNINMTCTQAFPSVFRPPVMQILQRDKLLKPYHETYGWRLRPSGYRWLAARGFPALPDQHTQRTGRRFENAAIVVTMYAAGITPFHDTLTALHRADCYVPASALRAQNGQHVLGSNQLVGLLRLNNIIYSVHYPVPGGGQLVIPQRENDCLDSMMLGAACAQSGFLFCGTSYDSAFRELMAMAEQAADRKRKKMSYAMFYEIVSQSRYILPCSRTGVLQLRVMRIPQYRQKLSAMLGGDTQPINEVGLPDCDFLEGHTKSPGRILVDMELSGVERAAKQAKAAGYSQLVLVGFDQQVRFLRRIYPPPFFTYIELPEFVTDLMAGGETDA